MASRVAPSKKMDPKKAVVYIRVSTDLSRQELGASAQRSACTAWAERGGVKIVEWVEEEVSGGARTRPGLNIAIDKLRELGAGILLCSKIDRFGRSLIYALQLKAIIESMGARLAFAEGVSPSATDPQANLMFNMMLSFAEFERNVIKQRIKDARAVMKKRAQFLGGQVPFGYQKVASEEPGKDGKLSTRYYLDPHPEEQATLQTLRQWRSEGMSWRRCAREGARLGLLRGGAARSAYPSWLRRCLLRHGAMQGDAPPYGYRWVAGEGEPQLEENPEEQRVLCLLGTWHVEGSSLRTIADRLKKMGVKTRSKRFPSPWWVREVLHELLKLSDPASAEGGGADATSEGIDKVAGDARVVPPGGSDEVESEVDQNAVAIGSEPT